MKTHIIYITLILLMFGGLFATLKWGNHHRDESNRKGQNIEALRADSTTLANRIVVTEKELKAYFPVIDSLQKAYGKREKVKVREVHTVTLHHNSVVHDTVVAYQLCPDLGPQEFYFPHGCLTSIVTYDPFYGTASDSLFGEITINRYLVSEKPRWLIFKPRYWNSKNWPQSVRIEQNCGFEIKENTIIEIK